MVDLGVQDHSLILEPMHSLVLSQRITSNGLSQDLTAVIIYFIELFGFFIYLHFKVLYPTVFLHEDFFFKKHSFLMEIVLILNNEY